MRFVKEAVPNGLEADIAKREFVFDNSGDKGWKRLEPPTPLNEFRIGKTRKSAIYPALSDDELGGYCFE